MAGEVPSPREQFIDAISVPDGEIDLARAALYVAAEEEPGLDVVAYQGHVALLAYKARKMLPGRHSVYDAIHTINQVLYEGEGFRGNRENYYDPKNCYLNHVIDGRKGIPITLSIIYMEIASRMGYPLRGIGMPGHYLLAAGKGCSEIYVDPFNNGGLLSRLECLRIALRGASPPKARRRILTKRYLPVSDKRSTLMRLLMNLKMIYGKNKDSARALKCAERIQLLYPRDWRNLGELARLQAEAGQYSRAVDSLEASLKAAPSDADTTQVENALNQLRAMNKGA